MFPLLPEATIAAHPFEGTACTNIRSAIRESVHRRPSDPARGSGAQGQPSAGAPLQGSCMRNCNRGRGGTSFVKLQLL